MEAERPSVDASWKRINERRRCSVAEAYPVNAACVMATEEEAGRPKNSGLIENDI